MAATAPLAFVLAVALATWTTHKELGDAPLRHLAIQAGCAMLALALAIALGIANESAMHLGALATLSLAIARVDHRTLIIPDVLVLGIGALALVAPYRLSLLEQAIGAVVMGAVFLLVREVYARVRNADGLGLGDVKLAVVMGATIGAEDALFWTAIAAALTALWLAAPAVMATSSARTAPAAAPFGVGLAAALVIATGVMAVAR